MSKVYNRDINQGAGERIRRAKDTTLVGGQGMATMRLYEQNRLAKETPRNDASIIEGCPPHHWVYPGAGQTGDVVCRKCGETKFVACPTTQHLHEAQR